MRTFVLKLDPKKRLLFAEVELLMTGGTTEEGAVGCAEQDAAVSDPDLLSPYPRRCFFFFFPGLTETDSHFTSLTLLSGLSVCICV